MRKQLLGLSVVLLVILTAGCNTSDILSAFEKLVQDAKEGTDEVPLSESGIVHDSDKIICGSWNIQDFGPSKTADNAVMGTIASVVDDYSLMAVQEVSNIECEDGSCNTIDGILNRLPSDYKCILSSRVGRSSNKEQYAIIFNRKVFGVKNTELYVDNYDIFEREPFIAHMQKLNGPDFLIVIVHLRPSDVPKEIAGLETVLEYAKAKYGDQDLMLVGDLNGDCAYYSGPLFPSMINLIPDYADTTVGNTDCAYDRIIITPSTSAYVEGVNVGYVDRRAEITQKVSDHYPVYFVWRGA